MLKCTYSDFYISNADQEFIDELLDKYNIREGDVELLLDGEMYGARFTNAVIYGIMIEIVNKKVENYDDKIKLIRQWKDLDVKIELDGELVDMEYGTLYLTDGDKLLKVWNGRGENELQEFIDECSSLKYDFGNQVFIS